MALADTRYGKSRIRVLKIDRTRAGHRVKELTVSLRFGGCPAEPYVQGDNRSLLPTDSMKNAVYALAHDHPLDAIEPFALVVGRNFLERHNHLDRFGVTISERAWIPLRADAFTAAGPERRLAWVQGDREGVSVEAGIAGLSLLKTAGSEFRGFLKDSFTTLAETSDRPLASTIRARWRYAGEGIDYNGDWRIVRDSLVEAFVAHSSTSLQQSLYAMAEAALLRCPDVAEIRLALPNLHCLPIDLTPFGRNNRGEIFQPTDEPRGVVEATLRR